MIDTNTVNYAINKIAQAMPAIKGGAEQMVSYTVFYAVTAAVGWLIIALILGLVGRALYKKGYDSNEEGWTIAAVVVWCFGLIFVVCFVCQGHEAIAAIAYPEMYTIQKLIGK